MNLDPLEHSNINIVQCPLLDLLAIIHKLVWKLLESNFNLWHSVSIIINYCIVLMGKLVALIIAVPVRQGYCQCCWGTTPNS